MNKFAASLLVSVTSAIMHEDIQQLLNLESQLQYEKMQNIQLQNLGQVFVGGKVGNMDGVNWSPTVIGGGSISVAGDIGSTGGGGAY